MLCALIFGFSGSGRTFQAGAIFAYCVWEKEANLKPIINISFE